MTAWQDQPPISRRQVRQNERADAADPKFSLAQVPEEMPPVEAFPREGWHEDARRSLQQEGEQAGTSQAPDAAAEAQQPQPPIYRVRDFSPDARRSTFSAPTSALNWAPPVAPGAAPVELDYHTQAAVPSSLASAPPPSVDPAGSGRSGEPVVERTMTRREMRALEQSGVLRPVDDSPVHEASDVPRVRERIRSTSIEAEQSAQLFDALAEFDSLTAAGPGVAADATPPALVEPPAAGHHTVYVASSSSVEQHPIESHEAPIDDNVVEATLEPETRMSGAWTLQSEAPAGDPVATEAVAVEPTWFDAIADEQAVDEAAIIEQPEAMASEAAFVPPVDSPAVFDTTPASTRFEDLLFNAPSVVEPEPFVAQLEPEPIETRTDDEWGHAAPLAAEPIQPFELQPAPAEWLAAFPPANVPEIVVPQKQEAPTPLAPAPGSYSPPVGHWSTQASIDDDEQVQENTFSRNVGATSGAITTSALVMPSIPTVDDILSPLGSTGEILITGSINLPSSMGTTGVHPARYDHSDVDALLEADDREDSDHPDSAPVRAIRAVSTHTATGAMISAQKPKAESRLPLILAVSAAAMAVGVVVLFVVGMIFKIF
jgi:hypothetical protein